MMEKSIRNGRLALVLPIILFVSTVLLGVPALRHVSGVAYVRASALLVVYLGWITFETRISFRERNEDCAEDKGTLKLYAIGQGATALAALGFFRIGLADVLGWAGFALFLLGIALRVYAIRTLGDLYSHRVRIQRLHNVIVHGPYRWVRHPAYAGMLLAHLGFVLVFFNWFATAALFLLLLPGVVFRISTEEKVMSRLSGYADFAATRKRLVPFIW